MHPNLQIIRRLLSNPDPADRDSLGWSSRVLAQVTLPYREPVGEEIWVRRNGPAALTITPWMYRDEETGETVRKFPYGSLPRLLMLYLSSEALRTKERRIDLGDNVWSFLREIGYTSRQAATYRQLREQGARLFNCGISFTYRSDKILAGEKAPVAQNFLLWWDKKDEEAQPKLLRSFVTLSESFYLDLQEHGFPVDLDIIRAFHASPLALDIYTWLTYRMRSINETGRPMRLEWGSLRWQFGGEFSRVRDFRRQFRETVAALNVYWPDLTVEDWGGGLTFKPSPRSVDRLPSTC
jgi:hypothetical protein